MITGGLEPKIIGLLIGATSLGQMISFTPASYIADIWGRRTCVGIGALMVIAASVAQIAVNSHWAFFGCRILAGAGAGTAQTAAPLLATEIAHPRQRQSATALYNATWCIGSLSSAVVTLATLSVHSSWSWKIPCVLQAVFPLIQIIGLFIVPESPRWLISKGRKEEALAILAKYHANDNVHDQLVQHEFHQICLSIDAQNQQPGSWSTFFSSKGDLHRLAICVIVGFTQEWTGNGMVFSYAPKAKSWTLTNISIGIISYYLAPILESVGIKHAHDQGAVNVGLQVWNLILSSAGALASERYGRRKLWLLSTASMLLFLCITTITAGLFQEKHITAAGIAVVPMMFLFFAGFDIAYASLFIAYPAEILPFQLRAKGLAVTLSTDAVACFFNQYVNPVAFSALQWKYYFVYVGCLIAFLTLIYFLFPETKGRSLEEISKIFDHRKTPDLDIKEKKDSDSSS